MYKFWDNLKNECEKQNLLLKDLAEKSGVNYGTIKNSIYRNVTPSIEIAYKLADVLGVSIEYLLTGNSPSNSRLQLLEDKLNKIKTIINE